MHLPPAAVRSARSDTVAAWQAPRPAGQIQNPRSDAIGGSPGEGPATSLDPLGPWWDGGVRSQLRGAPDGDPNTAPRVDGQIETSRNDPIRASVGSGPATGLDRLGHRERVVLVRGAVTTRVAIRTGRRGWIGKLGPRATTLYAARSAWDLSPISIGLGGGGMAVPVGCGVAARAAVRAAHRGWMGKLGLRATTLYVARSARDLSPVSIDWGFGGMAVPVGCGVAARAAVRAAHRGWIGKLGPRATTLYAARSVRDLSPVSIGWGFGGMAVPVGCGAPARAAIRTRRRGWMGKLGPRATTLYAARSAWDLPPVSIG